MNTDELLAGTGWPRLYVVLFFFFTSVFRRDAFLPFDVVFIYLFIYLFFFVFFFRLFAEWMENFEDATGGEDRFQFKGEDWNVNGNL